MGTGRRWAVDFSDQSTVPSSRDILDPPGFSRASPEQVLFFIFDSVLNFPGFSVVFLLDLSFNLKKLPGIELYCYWFDFRMIQQPAARRKTLKLIGNFRYIYVKSESRILNCTFSIFVFAMQILKAIDF